jgi:hypothetical protein
MAPRWLPVVLAVAIIIGAGASIAVMAPRTNSRAGASVARVWDTVASGVTAAVSSETAGVATTTVAKEPVPSPYFASFRGVKLHLPVAAASVTVLAFHQSSYNDSYPMKSLLKVGSTTAAAAAANKAKHAKKGTDLAASAGDERNSHGVWTGTALELWRPGRAGGLFTAADCGAKPGTRVCALVDGTVMEIRPYKLYGKYTDIEIHIKPDAWSDVDVVTLHVTDPSVKEGQHVIGGVTEIARVRHLSTIVPGLQLRTYSADGGNHTHVQVNRIPKPGQPWKLGQDPPGTVRRGN